MRLGFFDRLYRALLRFCPAEFRDEYGGEMARLFRDRCRREGALRVLFEALPDVAIAAWREHMDTLFQDFRYSLRQIRKRARGNSGVDRNLRRDGVFGDAADTGDRPPHGDGRTGGRPCSGS